MVILFFYSMRNSNLFISARWINAMSFINLISPKFFLQRRKIGCATLVNLEETTHVYFFVFKHFL